VNAEQLEILAPALAVGALVAIVHAPLGIEVLKRGIVFIDLAIAQIAGLNIVLVRLWWESPHWLWVQAVAGLSALVAALFFRWIEKTLPKEQEAVIGSSFILAASAALLALANHPQGGDEIRHILSGQILFATWWDAAAFLPVYATVFLVWAFYKRATQGLVFFLLLSAAITASVQLVGVYVVFASLILPALAVNGIDRGKVMHAWGCALVAVIGGITTTTMMDLPAGPGLVFGFAITALAYRLVFYLRGSNQLRAG
jgi:zinc/manganese transport system permease protein